MIEKIHICNKMNFSSNINEVIRAVLNFLLFFYEEISRAQISTKKHKNAQKSTKTYKKAQKSTKSTKSTKTQPSKSTKRK